MPKLPLKFFFKSMPKTGYFKKHVREAIQRVFPAENIKGPTTDILWADIYEDLLKHDGFEVTLEEWDSVASNFGANRAGRKHYISLMYWLYQYQDQNDESDQRRYNAEAGKLIPLVFGCSVEEFHQRGMDAEIAAESNLTVQNESMGSGDPPTGAQGIERHDGSMQIISPTEHSPAENRDRLTPDVTKLTDTRGNSGVLEGLADGPKLSSKDAQSPVGALDNSRKFLNGRLRAKAIFGGLAGLMLIAAIHFWNNGFVQLPAEGRLKLSVRTVADDGTVGLSPIASGHILVAGESIRFETELLETDNLHAMALYKVISSALDAELVTVYKVVNGGVKACQMAA